MARSELVSYIKELNGHIGDSVYYTVWNKTYVRKYVKPHNPRSEAQQSHRSLFSEAMALWKLLSDEDKQVYKKKVRKLAMHGHNLFIREYINTHKQDKGAVTNTAASEETVSRQCKIINNMQPGTYSGASPYVLRISLLSPYIQSISPLYPPSE